MFKPGIVLLALGVSAAAQAATVDHPQLFCSRSRHV
nr:MAG TPA_asm: hypothetical protein [Caudoviricetes sp.]